MTVSHKVFGNGTVISQDNQNVTVDFNGTVKTLITKFAKLTNEDGSEFGVQFEAKPAKARKQNQANRNVAGAFTNMTDSQKIAFLQEREKAAWSSKSW
jgi:epoxyqueuosine reductase QueG